MGRFAAILVSIAVVGGLQAFIVPLLALLLERQGHGALFNGISTTALFLGVIVASPFIERAVRTFGAKQTILSCLLACLGLMLLFPLWPDVYVWIGLRLLLGIALAGVYVATEIWLNRMLTAANRGRFFAFYGLAIAVGMMVGPQGIHLLHLSEQAPFWIGAAFFLIPFVLTWRVTDEQSALDPVPPGQGSGIRRWGRLLAFAPFAMGASFVYGYLDGALIGDFPIYGSRIGLSDAAISGALTLFMLGSITMQFPLGWLSDKQGRRRTLAIAAAVGLVAFLLLPLVDHDQPLLMAVLFLAGGALGSFYSLGLAYLGDQMDGRADMPTANVLYTMLYGVGSLLGPGITGAGIAWAGPAAFSWSVGTVLALYVLAGLVSGRDKSQAAHSKTQGV